MSKRGLSLDEKKVKLLELFHEHSPPGQLKFKGEFFTIKELEKIAPKQKGIVMQTVKDVLNDLTSDSLVQFDKIGTGNFDEDYWAFPSAAGAAKEAALSKAQQELEQVQSKVEETAQALEEARKGREDTPDRRKLLAQLDGLNVTSAQLKAELAAFGAADPVRYEKKKRAVEIARSAAMRWTDNTLILLQYAQNVLGASQEELRTQLEIPDEWDDLKL